MNNRGMKIKSLTAGVLAAVLFMGQIDIVSVFTKTDAEIVSAAETNQEADSGMSAVEISAFTMLPDEIRVQAVPVGTTLEELVLPDTLEAICVRKDADENTLGGKVDAEEDTEEIVPDEEADNGSGSSESPEDDLEEESSSEEEADRAETFSVTLPEYQTEHIIEFTTLEADSLSENPDEHSGDSKEAEGSGNSETSRETITIENVTWQSEPEYDGFMPGEYVFTAVLPDGYILTSGVNKPRITVQVYDGDAPLTAEQEAEMLAGLQNNPVLLTEADILADSPELAALAAKRIATFAALEKHPDTYIVTADNENNAGTGEADGDLDKYLFASYQAHPIEANIFIPEGQLPTMSCYVAVRTYDVDWQYGEYDKLFVNDVQIGVLTGLNNQWNTSYYQVPLSCLKKGKNTIRIEIWDCSDTSKVGDDNPPIKRTNRWSVSVDWMQLVCDGGSKEGVEEYSLFLTDAQTSGSDISFQAKTVIKTSSGGTFDTEYSIVNNKGFIYGSYQGAGVSGNESFTITMSKNSPDGTYTLQGMLKRRSDGTILATDSVDFRLQNGEAIVGPKLTHTLTPGTLTNQDVTIDVMVENAGNFTDINIAGSNRTVQTNGSYDFTYTYKDAKGTSYSNTYMAEVDNIDKEPPVINYTPVAVWPDMSGTEVEAQVRSALTVTDNVTSDCQVTVSGIPTNPAQYEGEQMSVTVTATDDAGNTATRQCAVNVLAMPFVLATPTAVRSGTTTSFTLSSKITALGGETVTETGFVWGIMQRPTLELNNGTGKTSSAVTTKDAQIKVTATSIVDGVTYYVRAYAKTKDGTVYYSEQATFGIDAKNFGAFSITYTSTSSSKSTFTIKRAGGTDGVQTVYYRTVNGSAIGGTHFTHAAGSVTFNEGDKTKTVQVTESGVTTAYGSNTATKYSNADRTYQVEIYRVEGGGALADAEDSRFATRTMTKDSNYTVGRTVYNEKTFSALAKTTGKNGVMISDDFKNIDSGRPQINYYKGTSNSGEIIKNFYNASNLSTFFSSNQVTYLQKTAQSWLYRYELSIYEDEDGYFNAIIRAATAQLEDKWYEKSSVGAAPGQGDDKTLVSLGLKWSACVDGISNQVDDILFPSTSRDNSGTSLSKATVNIYNVNDSVVAYGSNNWIQLDVSETAYAEFGANGQGRDVYYADYFAPHALVQDTVEPQLLGIAPMAGGTYKPGDKVTIALVFDEIVDSQNSSLNSLSSIETSWGIMTYAGGADTNVLYFTGTVPSDAGTTLSLTSLNCASSIKDMCNTSSTKAAGGSGSTNASVNTTTPTVTLSSRAFASGTASMKVTATNCNTLQYVWTNSTTLPVNGWIDCKSGDTLSTRQTSGKWYLHVLGTYSATGASVHKVSDVFDFGTPGSPATGAAAPELTVTANNTNWAQSRTINIVKTPSGGTVKLIKTPSGTANQTISANTYAAEANGTYTFTLTAGSETVTKSVQVSRIDRDAPQLTLREPGNVDTVYNELVFGMDVTDKLSGVSKVEYVIDNSASAPSSGWKTAAVGSDGSYSAAYTATNTDKSTYYIHVRATDNAGNVSAVKTSAGYTLIKAAGAADKPAITLSGAPVAWQNGDAALVWTVTEEGAGDCYLIEEGAEEAKIVTKDDTGTITAQNNGVYYISVTDSNGEIGEAKEVVNYIDKDAPVIASLSVTEGWAQSQTITAGGITDDITVQFTEDGLSAANSGSGVAKMEYREPGSDEWEEYTGDLTGESVSFTAVANGEYSIRLTDNVGNVGTCTVDVWGIDVTAPVVDCKVPTDSKVNGWYASAPEITITYKDHAGAEGPASGIADAKYAIVTDKTKPADSALQELPADGKVSLTQDGTYYLYYQVSDNAGNVTDSYTELIKIDMTEPAFGVSGQDEGQDVETGLTFHVSTGDFGLSGGYIIAAKSGTAESAAQKIVEVGEAVDGTAGGQTGTYQVTEPGTYYFKMYTNAGKSTEITLNIYKVTFDTKDGTVIPAQLVWAGQSATMGQGVDCKIVKPADPSREGYTFSGWYANAACSLDFDFNQQIDADTTVYAGWRGSQYQVSFDYQYEIGGDEEKTRSVFYGSSYGKLPAPERDGYSLKGWFTGENGGSVVESDTIVSIANDHTLYARWEANRYTVTFDYRGATGGNEEKTRSVIYDSVYDKLPAPVRTGYSFKGWFTEESGGSVVENDTIVSITEDHTIYAQWEANRYTVTFDYRGATDGNEEETRVVIYDSSYEELPAPTREGYSFIGWSAQEKGGNVIESDTIVSIAKDHTLYAQWSGNPYTVTFDYRGATGGNEEETRRVIYGSAYEKLPAPTRSGYSFKGWFTEESGGSMVESSTIVNIMEDHTLYARWSKKNASGGSGGGSTDGGSTEGGDGGNTGDGSGNTGDDDSNTDGENSVTPSTDKAPLPPDKDIQTKKNTDPQLEKTTDLKSEETTDSEPEGTEQNANLSDKIEVGEGSVIVTLDSDGYRGNADVTDTAAVANTVLTPEQISLVNGGETIEIRIEVKDISEPISKEDKDIIESGIKNSEKILGAYIDISMYIRIGDGDWDVITQTDEPIEVIIEIPGELRSDDRKFYLARSHEGEFALLPDLDNEPDTITFRTERFSAYAILYEQTGMTGENEGNRCGLCHICPTFLGICCFIWLAAIVAVIVIMIVLIHRKRRKEEKETS